MSGTPIISELAAAFRRNERGPAARAFIRTLRAVAGKTKLAALGRLRPFAQDELLHIASRGHRQVAEDHGARALATRRGWRGSGR